MVVTSPGYGPGPELPDAFRLPTLLLMASTPWWLSFSVRAPPMVFGAHLEWPGAPMLTGPWGPATWTAPPTVLPQRRMVPGDWLATMEPLTVEFSRFSEPPGFTTMAPFTLALTRQVGPFDTLIPPDWLPVTVTAQTMLYGSVFE